ncbi:DNA internalization-related competence protein ComEC/Rec2 [Metabacillus niabensis]|uniref:DNA internalization-related competence protein ComEC/Rec2 n=1 Tax=Metabacillus niabensis TaxID=324854 RepID=UPI001F2C1873|nr:DNA internalization-related competence protein ComEC/Rec2 [Metabacillus niabensis]
MPRFQFHPLLFFLITCLHIFLFFKKKASLFLFCLLTKLIFMSTYLIVDYYNQTSLKEGEYNGEVVFSSIPVINGDQFKGEIVNSFNEKLTFYYRIKSPEEKISLEKINPGMSCRFSGELEMPKLPTVPNAFNYKQYLYEHKIHWQYWVDEISQCKSEENNWYEKLLIIRKKSLEFIEEHFPKESAGIVQALLFGERSLLQQEIEIAYQELGIVHLLAISGLHVALLVSAFYYMLVICGVTHEKARLIMLIILPVYTILTGATPSVIRASFMVIVYLLIKHFKMKFSSVDVISFTCLVLLLINPYYLFQVGFQLSYVVSYGLLLSFKMVEQFTHSIVKLGLISLVAQLCSMPIILYNFYEISLLSLPMNMLFVPLYSYVILPFAIFSTVITVFSTTVGESIIHLFNQFLQFTHHIVLFSKKIPYTTVTTGKPPILFIIALTLSTIYFFYQLECTKKQVYKSVTILFLVIAIQLATPYINPNGKVVVLDVGQGDAIFIQRPFNKGNYLIDTGGKVTFQEEEWQKTNNQYSIANKVIIPYMKSLGVTKLDALFLTHGDMDHIGEAVPLMEGMAVNQLIIPEGFIRGELEEAVIRKAQEKQMNILIAKAGDKISLNQFFIHVLSPITLSDSKNDDSLVLLMDIGGLSWLFTGDAELEAEKRMIKRFPSLKVDILKLGHHGSKGSSSELFLDKLEPALALVSVGLNNRYQHPHTEVLDKLKERNIPLLRTDLQGSILYQFKGNRGTFSTHPPYDKVKVEKEKETTKS